MTPYQEGKMAAAVHGTSRNPDLTALNPHYKPFYDIYGVLSRDKQRAWRDIPGLVAKNDRRTDWDRGWNEGMRALIDILGRHPMDNGQGYF
jgi:hypothetical protein